MSIRSGAAHGAAAGLFCAGRRGARLLLSYLLLCIPMALIGCNASEDPNTPEPPVVDQPEPPVVEPVDPIPPPVDEPEIETAWIGTWTTAQQLVEPNNNPPAPGLSNNTLRQVVRVSLGGERVRLRLSNEFSNSPVTVNAVHIADSVNAGAIDPSSDQALTFSGQANVTIPAGAAVTSDPVAFAVQPRSNLAITIHFGTTAADITGHPGSRTTSYIQSGAAVGSADLSGSVTTDHWYVITDLEVEAPETAAAVVILGDSITDGRGSGTNQQNRWPDELARRLQTNAGTEDVAVLNQGIGGNCVLRACLGPAAVDRFERDVLNQAGVQWLIILEGINDIGGAQGNANAVAQSLIAAYQDMIERAHDQGILVYGATLLPFGGSSYDSPDREAARTTVNQWIRTSGRFDAVIDFETAMGDPANPLRLLPAADTGDRLHPNENGHRLMAESVDLQLFQ